VVLISIIRNRMGVVDSLIFTRYVEPDLREVGAEIRTDPDMIHIELTREQYQELQESTVATFNNWAREGKLKVVTDQRMERAQMPQEVEQAERALAAVRKARDTLYAMIDDIAALRRLLPGFARYARLGRLQDTLRALDEHLLLEEEGIEDYIEELTAVPAEEVYAFDELEYAPMRRWWNALDFDSRADVLYEELGLGARPAESYARRVWARLPAWLQRELVRHYKQVIAA